MSWSNVVSNFQHNRPLNNQDDDRADYWQEDNTDWDDRYDDRTYESEQKTYLEPKILEEKPIWKSKIFWVQAMTFMMSILTGFGLNIEPEYQKAAIEVISGLAGGSSLITIVFRVFFTNTRLFKH